MARVADPDDCFEIPRQLCLEFEPQGSLLFCGILDDIEHSLYLVEGLRSLELIDLCHVGSHNAPQFPEDPWKQVLAGMEEIYRAVPFASYFADEAGYKARFLEPLNESLAKRFEDVIAQFNGEAGCLADDEGYELWEFMCRRGEVALWWD